MRAMPIDHDISCCTYISEHSFLSHVVMTVKKTGVTLDVMAMRNINTMTSIVKVPPERCELKKWIS